ncbi:MAG: hypothetical protein Kow0092_15170 [Deferrisomatales bacterium]
MREIQTAFLFAAGYLVSRLVVQTPLPERLLYLGAKPGARLGALGLCLRILAAAAALSAVVPNVLVVLTLLPVVNRLGRGPAGEDAAGWATAKALALLYGANIGGMASLTGTPANGVLVAWLVAAGIPRGPAVSYAGWLVWGVPLSAALTAVAAGVILLVSGRAKSPGVVTAPAGPPVEGRERWAVRLSIAYLTAGFALSAVSWAGPPWDGAAALVTGVATLGFAAWCSLWPVRELGREPLLRPGEVFRGIPPRGAAFVALSVGAAWAAYRGGLHRAAAAGIARLLPLSGGAWLSLFALSLGASFATEAVSNTAVQVSLLVLLEPLAPSLPCSYTRAALAVTLSSTCAFMSPLATGVNGFVYGGIRGVSLWRMLAAGVAMNLAAAALMSTWVRWLPGL